jgi:hypothetical protein
MHVLVGGRNAFLAAVLAGRSGIGATCGSTLRELAPRCFLALPKELRMTNFSIQVSVQH